MMITSTTKLGDKIEAPGHTTGWTFMQSTPDSESWEKRPIPYVQSLFQFFTDDFVTLSTLSKLNRSWASFFYPHYLEKNKLSYSKRFSLVLEQIGLKQKKKEDPVLQRPFFVSVFLSSGPFERGTDIAPKKFFSYFLWDLIRCEQNKEETQRIFHKCQESYVTYKNQLQKVTNLAEGYQAQKTYINSLVSSVYLLENEDARWNLARLLLLPTNQELYFAAWLKQIVKQKTYISIVPQESHELRIMTHRTYRIFIKYIGKAMGLNSCTLQLRGISESQDVKAKSLQQKDFNLLCEVLCTKRDLTEIKLQGNAFSRGDFKMGKFVRKIEKISSLTRLFLCFDRNFYPKHLNYILVNNYRMEEMAVEGLKDWGIEHFKDLKKYIRRTCGVSYARNLTHLTMNMDISGLEQAEQDKIIVYAKQIQDLAIEPLHLQINLQTFLAPIAS